MRRISQLVRRVALVAAISTSFAIPLAAQEEGTGAKPTAPAEAKPDDAKKASDLPLKKIVLFNSGVGFYEHKGDITGNAHVDLKFKVDDVNDLLKSMVLQDMGGGRISTINYDSKDPITRTLKTFAIDLTTNPTLADLLRQIRGEQIQIDAPTPITGTIVGVEKRKVRVGKEETVEQDFITLLTDEGLRSINLDSVMRIKLSDPQLNKELTQALKTLAMGHSTDKKTVSLNFLGEGKRPVSVGYIQESPIWKTSYRLVLDDKEKPFLQGWAIVENTTEEDWNDVNLTLVSGRPISFVMDLYQPLYLRRPVVQPELHASLTSQTYGQSLADADGEFMRNGRMAEQMDRRSGITGNAPASAAPTDNFAGSSTRGAMGMGGGSSKSRLQLSRGVQAAAQGGDVGELFQYTIDTPVKLNRQQSAMLPIVNEKVEGEKLSIYNQRV
ncbi:MAG: hypothetical protein SGJ20_20905, partial [Planctomycetota bacterium]|nr:hypothetical protein [Planctomycetota bacterium]